MDVHHKIDTPKPDSSDTEDFFHELAALNDIGLLRATMESLECGRLTPLIKEELRCRIQSRRLSEGKEELLVEFPSPTPSQPRPDEVEKRDRRREQNRRAAQKFRKKKKQRGEHLIEETQRLEYHNTSLRSEIKQLHEEREQLARIIQNHASVCPLTPRHSPLTIPRDSPVPGGIRESPETLPSSSSSTITTSPVLGKRSALSPVLGKRSALSPVLLPPLTRDSPVPLLIINSEKIPVSTSVVTCCPVSISGRPRKSPVSLIRSPAPGDTSGLESPISCGSPAKQTKHSVPPRLTLSGPKPIIPLLPKSTYPGSPSPRTPKSTVTSPLTIAPSPISGTRVIHASPIFFGEGGYTPPSHGQHTNPSPLSASNSSSSSTPGRIAQQSPIFFGDRAPRSADTNFLQPMSTSSVSSTSSLPSLLRQESPLSVLSNSSGVSNASSVFITNNTNHNTCFSGITETPRLASNNDNSNIYNSLHSFPDQPQSVYSCSSQSSFPENPDDNVLSLDEIERSASGFEARDDLLDFMDIQALLDLSGDHNGNDIETTSVHSGNTIDCHLSNHTGNSTHHIDIEHPNISASASDLDNISEIEHNQSMTATPQQAAQSLFSALVSQTVNPTSSLDSGQSSDMTDKADTSSQCAQSLPLNHNSYHIWDADAEQDCRQHPGCANTERDHSYRNSSNNSESDTLQRRGEPVQGHAPLAGHLHQLHNFLRDIILAQSGGHIENAETNTLRQFLLNKFARELDPSLSNNNDRSQGSSVCTDHHHHHHQNPKGNNNSDCNIAACNQDRVNSQSTSPLDVLSSPRGSHDYGRNSTPTHKSQ